MRPRVVLEGKLPSLKTPFSVYSLFTLDNKTAVNETENKERRYHYKFVPRRHVREEGASFKEG